MRQYGIHSQHLKSHIAIDLGDNQSSLVSHFDVPSDPQSGLTYGPVKVNQRAGDRETSSERAVYQRGADRLSNTKIQRTFDEQLFIHVNEPLAENKLEEVRADLEARHRLACPTGTVSILKTWVIYEEICTWIPVGHELRVINELPVFVRKMRSVGWKLTVSAEEDCIVVNGLRFPDPFKIGKRINQRHIQVALKLYRWRSDSPVKVEIQCRVKRGVRIKYNAWRKYVRSRALSYLDAFLVFCGVESSFIARADNVTPIHQASNDGRGLANEFFKARVSLLPFPPLYANQAYVDLVRGRCLPLDDRHQAVHKAVLSREFHWIKFYENFPAQVASIRNDGQKKEIHASFFNYTRKDLVSKCVLQDHVNKFFEWLRKAGLSYNLLEGRKDVIVISEVYFLYRQWFCRD